jgi:hypothetical protein
MLLHNLQHKEVEEDGDLYLKIFLAGEGRYIQVYRAKAATCTN